MGDISECRNLNLKFMEHREVDDTPYFNTINYHYIR